MTQSTKRSVQKVRKGRTRTTASWATRRDAFVLDLFQRMAERVPAYKRFLRANGVRASSIESAKDISDIPLMNKDTYLKTSQYKDLFWDGDVAVPHVMTSTSGSTGAPVYFARSRQVDEQSAFVHERFFLQSSLSKTKPTLVIVCFGMGVWIGGVITYQAFQCMQKKGYPISIITPGINKSEIFKTLKTLAPNYEQIIFTGYPPFIKDLFDEMTEQGISLTRHRIGVVFAAEAFTEHFRDYLAEKAHIRNVLTDTMNVYGSADLGTMATETPLSILARRLATSKPAAFAALFGNITKTPTLAQFIPTFTAFEEANGQLILSGNSAMPLVRYSIGDNGGVFSYEEIAQKLASHGIDLEKEMRRAKIDSSLKKLPFVYVYERADLSTTLYGLQIYPETVREALLQEAFTPFITGRFALSTKYDDHHDQYLEIHIELRSGKEVTKGLHNHILAEIVKNLKLKNGEFNELAKFLGEQSEPRLVFWPHEDPLYFRRDIKQRWVLKPPEA
jgi:phenylacetate-CoA ligase